MATNYLIGEDGASLPDGIVLQHTLHGEPDRTVTHAYTASGSEGVRLVPATDGVEYVPSPMAQPKPLVAPVDPRAKRCKAKDDTCMGWRINESDFCAAHAGKLYDRWKRDRESGAIEPSVPPIEEFTGPPIELPEA